MTWKTSIIVASILLFSSAVSAQTVQPTPASTPPDDDGKVVKVSTALIQIDVSVTDERGRIIRDIKPEEVEIFENGVKQQITSFSFVSKAEKAAVEKKKKDESKTAVPEPSCQSIPVRLQTRVFHDRKKVFEGEERQLDLGSQAGTKETVFTDAVALGQNLLPGDYVLQVIVTDGLAKEKKRIATQYVQFEVIE